MLVRVEPGYPAS